MKEQESHQWIAAESSRGTAAESIVRALSRITSERAVVKQAAWRWLCVAGAFAALTLPMRAWGQAIEAQSVPPKDEPAAEHDDRVRATTPEPAPERSSIDVPTATWVFFGIGAGTTALVGVFGGLTLDAQATFNEEPTWAHADAFYALRASTNVAIGVTGAALLTGAIIWVVDAAVSKRAAREKRASSPPWAFDVTW